MNECLGKQWEAVVSESAQRMEEAFRAYRDMAEFLDDNFATVTSRPQTAPSPLPGFGGGKEVISRYGSSPLTCRRG